jgi:HNH endonuclease
MKVEAIYLRISPEPTSGCWLWEGSHDARGYGVCRDPNTGTMRGVHRVVFEIERGPIAPGMTLDHLCRNPACVNPDHLEPVPHRVNLARGIGAETSRKRMIGNQLYKQRSKRRARLKYFVIKK